MTNSGKRFAAAPMDRQHTVIDLDAAIPDDHAVRLLDEILNGLDWTDWEDTYHGKRGQPPIPPRILAGILIYGLFHGFRSTRILEYLCRHNLDFLWLAHGFHPDHATIAQFRTRFAKPLKDLFRQVGLMAVSLGLLRLGKMGFDGTRVKANNGRSQTDTAPSLRNKLAEVEKLLAEWWDQHAAAEEESGLSPAAAAGNCLPKELKDAQARKEKLEQALAKVLEMDEARRKDGIDPQKHPAQICRTDIDGKVMPNKEGGFAPNYTPLAGVDVNSGFILYDHVANGVSEHPYLLEAVDQVEADFGKKLDQVLADGAMGTGVNLAGMEERQVEFFTPVPTTSPESNPAVREDPTQSVPEDQQARLPRNPGRKLDRRAFVYDAEQDVYYCPQGEKMPYEKTKPETRQGERVERRVYRAPAEKCAGCELRGGCVGENNKGGRTITRDEHEGARERAASRMSSAEGKKTYQARFHAAEAPFGILKAVMGLRQFLLRGLAKVRLEWRWACLAYNLRKLVRYLQRIRHEAAGRAGSECAPREAESVLAG